MKHQVEWCSMIPFCLKAIVAQTPPPNHNYRFWGPAVHIPEVDVGLGINTIGWWGMTETITQGIVGDFEHRGPEMSIGRAGIGYEISINRPDGIAAEPRERGALFIRGVRGVSLFKEYYGNPEATASSFNEDGWFETGDLIQIGEDGNLFFSDREKDMLKVGGENVAALEVESVILETGWVDECAVLGQEHWMLDEVPVAFVIPLPNAPENLALELINVCKANLDFGTTNLFVSNN